MRGGVEFSGWSKEVDRETLAGVARKIWLCLKFGEREPLLFAGGNEGKKVGTQQVYTTL